MSYSTYYKTTLQLELGLPIAALINLLIILILINNNIPAAATITNNYYNHKELLDISINIDLTHLLSSVCNLAIFPSTCLAELSSFSIDPATATPLTLVTLSTQAAQSKAQEAQTLASQLSSASSVLQTLQCSQDCAELMSFATARLDSASQKLAMASSSTDFIHSSFLSDVKLWLSEALSFQAACHDSFDELGYGDNSVVQQQIQNNQDYFLQVVGNTMALVEALSRTGNDINTWISAPPSPISPVIHFRRRRLLMSQGFRHSDVSIRREKTDSKVQRRQRVRQKNNGVGFPKWVSVKDRRMILDTSSTQDADVVVAQDGTGDYLTISEALQNIPQGYNGAGRYVVHVRQGVYYECFNVTHDLPNLSLVGDGIGVTVISGDRNVASGMFNTYRTATVGVSASGFFARDITFRNTAGAIGHQAVAFKAQADMLLFHRCSFEGYQDTLYTLSSRQFYKDCVISGTIDFIFGNAIAVFQTCQLLARQPLPGQQNTVTAQGRKLSVDISGFSFQNCTISFDPSGTMVSTFLGRPWKAYSRVVFMQSSMDSLVDPAGWLPWNESNPFTDTLYYGEYLNYGPGSDTSHRVGWVGVHPTMSYDEANQFTVENFIAGDDWIDSTQVDYEGGLS